jgi:hypothetical protein
MKKYLFFSIFLSMAFFGQAQQNKPSNTAGIGLGLGILTSESSILNASMNLEGDMYLSKAVSIMGHVDYNRLFATSGGGSAGFMTAHVGPRVHITDKFFAGVGIGYAYFAGDGTSAGAFSYYPHIGLDFKRSQLSLNYKAITDQGTTEGMIGLGFLLKFGKTKSAL